MEELVFRGGVEGEEERGAAFSHDQLYRYLLWRVWEPGLPRVLFIGLNPSTADEKEDDPTIRRCRGFAKRWGYGGMLMANLFAFRATDPKELKEAIDPVGPENDRWLLNGVGLCDKKVVLSWGDWGSLYGRGVMVLGLLKGEMLLRGKFIQCFGLTKKGHPKHPLYLRKDTEVIDFKNW